MRSFIGAGLSIVAVTYGLARYVFGLFLPQIQFDLNLTTQTMGVIASVSYIGYLLATVIGTYISAVTGPRFPIILGGIAATIGMVIIANSHSSWMLMLGVLIAGASPGFSYPPLSDAIVNSITSAKRSRVYSWINTGTSFGIILAGPIALISGDDWRFAWLIFAFFALGATIWNYFKMPGKSKNNTHGAAPPKVGAKWYLKSESIPLFLAAISLGIITSVYWTFSVDLIVTEGNYTQENTSIFWVLVGISGIAGGVAGLLVEKFGLRMIFQLCVLLISISIAILGFLHDIVMLGFVSGILFGASFIAITALLGIWSVYVFSDRPSAGFGATFFLISLGQFIGPMFAGFVGAEIGLPLLFLLSALSQCQFDILCSDL